MDIDKIRDEMAKSGDQAIQVIGEYATTRVLDGCTVADGKTLKGAFDAIRDYAKKHQRQGYAIVVPDDAYRVVDDYYGWPHRSAATMVEAASQAPAKDEEMKEPAEEMPTPVEEPKQAASAFALPDLDDLLGG